MAQIVTLLAVLVLGFVSGGLTMWLLIDGDDVRTAELLARENALRARIGDLHALLHVPPLFWQVWERYTHEHAQHLLEDLPNVGKHTPSQNDKPDDKQQDDDIGDDHHGSDGRE